MQIINSAPNPGRADCEIPESFSTVANFVACSGFVVASGVLSGTFAIPALPGSALFELVNKVVFTRVEFMLALPDSSTRDTSGHS